MLVCIRIASIRWANSRKLSVADATACSMQELLEFCSNLPLAKMVVGFGYKYSISENLHSRPTNQTKLRNETAIDAIKLLSSINRNLDSYQCRHKLILVQVSQANVHRRATWVPFAINFKTRRVSELWKKVPRSLTVLNLRLISSQTLSSGCSVRLLHFFSLMAWLSSIRSKNILSTTPLIIQLQNDL